MKKETIVLEPKIEGWDAKKLLRDLDELKRLVSEINDQITKAELSLNLRLEQNHTDIHCSNQ